LQYLRWSSYSLPTRSLSQPGGKRATQQDAEQDDKEERLGREYGATQLETPNTRRNKAKWVEELIQKAQEHVEALSSMFRHSQ